MTIEEKWGLQEAIKIGHWEMWISMNRNQILKKYLRLAGGWFSAFMYLFLNMHSLLRFELLMKHCRSFFISYWYFYACRYSFSLREDKSTSIMGYLKWWRGWYRGCPGARRTLLTIYSPFPTALFSLGSTSTISPFDPETSPFVKVYLFIITYISYSHQQINPCST